MGEKRWYVADALGADLTNRQIHLRAESEEEVQRRMRERYPEAVAVLIYSEESWRRRSASIIAPEGRVR
jgi:hypothetical protein